MCVDRSNLSLFSLNLIFIINTLSLFCFYFIITNVVFFLLLLFQRTTTTTTTANLLSIKILYFLFIHDLNMYYYIMCEIVIDFL